jgi:hypothetical protein
MRVDGKDSINNCFIATYVPAAGSGRIEFVSNDEPGQPQVISRVCAPRRKFFSTAVIARLISLMFVLSLNWTADGATPGATSTPGPTLQHREGLPPEGCEDHVARTRHTYLDTAQVVEDPKDRRDLLAIYNRLSNDKLVLRMCTQPKFLVWYDLDLSMVELQRQYIITNR